PRAGLFFGPLTLSRIIRPVSHNEHLRLTLSVSPAAGLRTQSPVLITLNLRAAYREQTISASPRADDRPQTVPVSRTCRDTVGSNSTPYPFSPLADCRDRATRAKQILLRHICDTWCPTH